MKTTNVTLTIISSVDLAAVAGGWGCPGGCPFNPRAETSQDPPRPPNDPQAYIRFTSQQISREMDDKRFRERTKDLYQHLPSSRE